MDDAYPRRRADAHSLTLRDAVVDHLDWMRGQGYAVASIDHRRRCLDDLMRSLLRVGCTRTSRVTARRLEEWASDLATRKKANGCALSATTRANLVYAVRGFFRAAVARGIVAHDPSSVLRIHAPPPPLPRLIPTVRAIFRILSAPDTHCALGLRDRAMLELLYASGLRRGELVGLHLHDLDLDGQTLFVHPGKGGRDRVVPIGPRASRWIARYLKRARRALAVAGSGTLLFVGRRGRALRPTSLGDRLRPYVRTASVAGSCHVFRHACAIHMLEGGADIRFIQEMLGHARLATTQIYTRVSIDALRFVHAATHPSASFSEPSRPRAAVRSQSRSVDLFGLFRIPCRRAGHR